MMISVLRLLQDVDSALKITGETGGIEEEICITRSKSRFGKPTSGGWADIMINFYFKDDEEGWAHICEIQLVHAHLYGVRKNMGAHKNYSDFRAALELCEKVGADPEEGSDATVLEALVWKKSTRRSSVTPAPMKQASSDFAAVLEKMSTLEAQNEKMAAQMEKMATLEAQNERMAAQMEKMAIIEAQNEQMSAQMKKMAATLTTLVSKLPTSE
jgi:hypothetical protein